MSVGPNYIQSPEHLDLTTSGRNVHRIQLRLRFNILLPHIVYKTNDGICQFWDQAP